MLSLFSRAEPKGRATIATTSAFVYSACVGGSVLLIRSQLLAAVMPRVCHITSCVTVMASHMSVKTHTLCYVPRTDLLELRLQAVSMSTVRPSSPVHSLQPTYLGCDEPWSTAQRSKCNNEVLVPQEVLPVLLQQAYRR